MNYKDLLIFQLSGVAEWKNEKEMIVPYNMKPRLDLMPASGIITCEFLGNNKYVLRNYYSDGFIYWRTEYKNEKRHGNCKGFSNDGDLLWDRTYKNGNFFCVWVHTGA